MVVSAVGCIQKTAFNDISLLFVDYGHLKRLIIRLLIYYNRKRKKNTSFRHGENRNLRRMEECSLGPGRLIPPPDE